MHVTVFSPAKLNLFLAITGRRADGFHDLVSVVAPLDFGDDLRAEVRSADAGAARFTLTCDAADVPVDGTNLILRAAEAFAAATGWGEAVHFQLTKRIPVGAGLGGGSSNAVAALLALEQLSGGAAGEATLGPLAAGLGSDCPLFLSGAPVVMRGRGECVEPLAPVAAERLRGRRVLVFKPAFGVSTPWAYGRMIARGADYLSTDAAEARLATWTGGTAPAEALLYNNLEPAVFAKHLALPVLLEKLRADFGVAAMMSGSGSACFALLRDDTPVGPLAEQVRAAWGPAAVIQEARLASK